MHNPEAKPSTRRDSLVYPKPDRSDQTPNAVKTPENDVLDIGWNEGVLSDGRPYRVECWAQDQVTSLTYFFSTHGLETMTNAQFAELLVREGLLQFTSSQRYVAARPLKDASANAMWSVNVVLGDDEQTFVDDRVPLRRYAKPGKGD